MDMISDILFKITRKYMEEVVDEASEQINVKVNEITKKFAYVMRELVPSLVYSTLFVGAGVLIFIVGASEYLDTLLNMEGAGPMIGGLLLLALGYYYNTKLNEAMETIEKMSSEK